MFLLFLQPTVKFLNLGGLSLNFHTVMNLLLLDPNNFVVKFFVLLIFFGGFWTELLY